MRLSYLRIPKWALVAILVGLSPIFLLSGLLLLLAVLAQAGLLSNPVTLSGIFNGSIFSNVGTLALMMILLFFIVMSLLYAALCRSLYRRFSVSKEQHDAHLAEVQRQLESNALGERLKAAEQEADKVIMEKILSDLRLIIGEDLEPSYETKLTIADPPQGLAEAFKPTFEITTEARGQLRRLLKNMPGGSIGVSGPRGVGKTTLLESFCGKASINTTLKDRPVLSVMTSAPVEYDPREFILHIFASVCHRVVEDKQKKVEGKDEIKGQDDREPWGYMSGIQKPPITFLSTIISFKEALAVILLRGFLMSTLFISKRLGNLSDFFLDFFFGLGLFFVIIGIVGLLIQAYQKFEQQRQTRREKQEDTKLYGNDPLVKEARDHLHEIKFQQSYTSGWAGSLKGGIASISAETSVQAAVNLSQKQRSLPEIVDSYRKFLILASQEYEIIIGIDELDKIGSDKKAHHFLNEIKSLFYLEKCFYLISVSESAMSSFERRGMPFRDVFDSSFDAIVHVDYLNLDKAKRLLRRRVIGVPVPFLDFCHCMAGGLPRDLIRTFRSLYAEHAKNVEDAENAEHAEHTQADSGESSLSMLCNSLIRTDLRSKLRATSIAAKDIAFGSEGKELFSRISELEASLESSDELSSICESLLANYRKLSDNPSSEEPANQSELSEAAAKRRERLTSLSDELEVYLHYCATLQNFFGQEDLGQETLRAAEDSGTLERLATARQLLAISPRMVEAAVAPFQKEYLRVRPGSSVNFARTP
jgi:GTPase SAR1 family protein